MNRDVLIIGGGVIGLSIARELHKGGVRNIALVEKGVCGQESSWAAAGMLGPQAEADETGPFFEFCTASRVLFPDLAVELLNETGIDIELDRTGTISLAFSDKEEEELRQRSQWQHRAALEHETLSAKDVLGIETQVSPAVQFGLYFPNDWQVENRKLLAALRRFTELNKVDLLENTGVDRLIVETGVVKGVETTAGTILADITVLATGAWTSLIKFGGHSAPFEVIPVRGQMIAFRLDPQVFRHVLYSRRGYVVPRVDGRVLAGSTSEHVGYDKGATDVAANDLWTMASQISQRFADLEMADHWSGLRPFASDGLPLIGPVAGYDGLLIATAHYRNGILLAPITAKTIAAKIVDGASSNMFELYSPDRFAQNRTVGLSS